MYLPRGVQRCRRPFFDRPRGSWMVEMTASRSFNCCGQEYIKKGCIWHCFHSITAIKLFSVTASIIISHLNSLKCSSNDSSSQQSFSPLPWRLLSLWALAAVLFHAFHILTAIEEHRGREPRLYSYQSCRQIRCKSTSPHSILSILIPRKAPLTR